MPVSARLPLLKRIPPGLWTALVWFAAAVQPIVENVVLPARHEYCQVLDHEAGVIHPVDRFDSSCVARPSWPLVSLGRSRRRVLDAGGRAGQRRPAMTSRAIACTAAWACSWGIGFCLMDPL
jgi:hypothetical protein